MEAASTVVIKVKYRDVLRRFDGQIANEELDLSMDGLKEKIISLFSLAPGTELMLTYIDQDGDVVNLVDADDLRDVVKQGLDPLRITVKLHRPLQNLHDGVSRILQNVPDPLRETLMKLSVDLTSKCITELVDCFSKIGLSYLGQLYESQTRAKRSTNSSFPENSRAQTMTKDTDMSKANAAIPKVQSHDIEEPSFKSNESLTKLQHEATTETNKLRLINITGGSMETSSSKALGLKAASLALDFKNSNVGKKEQTLGESSCISSDPPSVGNIVPTENEVNEPNDPNVGPKTENINAPDTTKEDYIGGRIGCVFPDVLGCSPGSLLMPTPGISNLTGSLSGHSPTYESLFSGIPDGNTSAAPLLPTSQAVPFRSSSTQNDDLDILFNWGVLHQGVRCDGCGIHPITGPRFKSKINVDYDLCNICFSVIGNDTDFIRIDQPMVHQKHMCSKGYCDPYQIPTLPQVCSWVSKKKSCASKLDSCFIQNVTVTDGTIMAPLTPFTKIWRMRNNGMVVWPQKTQLVWTGGDRLTNQFSVEVEIPAIGLRVDEDLDIAVDLIAPEFPGRYISYWRMVSPSGQKFGQRVWVLIQVDASVKETEDSKPEPNDSKKTPELVEPVVDLQPNNFQEMKFPTNDILLVANAPIASSQDSAHELPEKKAGDGASSSVPFAGFPIPGPAIHMPSRSPPPAPISSSHESAVELPGKEEVVEKLLGELEEAGFKQVGLNKETWKMDEYVLKQAVDNLSGVAEWGDLAGMGFHNAKVKKILLKKNKGRIKRVGYGSRWC